MTVTQRLLPVVGFLVLALAACGGPSGADPAVPAAPVAAGPSSTSSAAAPAEHPTVWVCHPGRRPDPCLTGLGTVQVRPGSPPRELPVRAASTPPIDCFYVYPTVSSAPGSNAPLKVTPEVLSTVRSQAALFSQVCRVFAPAYRQATVAALLGGKYGDPDVRAIAHADVVSAWHDYLDHDNHGRGVVLIGHSQGALELTRIAHDEIESDPAELHLLVSALLLGGGVYTADGQDTGGSFTSLETCRHPGQTPCVVAYSTFGHTPTSASLFGRATAGFATACTDPTALTPHGGDHLDPYLPTARVGTGLLEPVVVAPGSSRASFVSYPDQFTARCRTADGATFLQVTRDDGAAVEDRTETLGPAFGLHLDDVNLTIGDLVAAVRLQGRAWLAAR